MVKTLAFPSDHPGLSLVPSSPDPASPQPSGPLCPECGNPLPERPVAVRLLREPVAENAARPSWALGRPARYCRAACRYAARERRNRLRDLEASLRAWEQRWHDAESAHQIALHVEAIDALRRRDGRPPGSDSSLSFNDSDRS